MAGLMRTKRAMEGKKSPTQLLSRPQRPVGPLAGLSGDGGLLSESSNSVSSLVKPSVHVG